MKESTKNRCPWGEGDPLSLKYHDTEWGVPVHDDRLLFEFLILEGAQAGLSWRTILHRRENYRKAFDNFDPRKVARFTPARVERLLKDSGIIRNRLKINAAIDNAKAFLAVQKEFGSFDKFVWGFVDGKTKDNRLKTYKGLPPETEESRAMSKELRKRGFRFVGPTICYGFMQAVGLVNDHLVSCFRYKEVKL